MKKTLILTSAAVWLATAASAQFSFTGIYSENFDNLPNLDPVVLTGTGTVGNQVAIPGASHWQGTRLGGSQTSDTELWPTPSTGGRFYAYGSGTDTERALGHLGSGSFSGAFGVSLVNDSGQTIDSITIDVAAEIWVVQGTSTTNLYEHRLSFAYGTSAQGITGSDFLTSASMTAQTDLDVISVDANTITETVSGTDPDRTRDGNSATWRTPLSVNINSLSWAPGETLYLRWSGDNGSGFDAGLAIDDITVVPEPGTAALLFGIAGLALVAVVRRRR